MARLRRYWSVISPMHYLGRNFVSRWVILLFDMILVSLSLFLAYFLQSKATLYDFRLESYLHSLMTVLSFLLVGHYVFKPHTGIIRHTSLYDVRRVFLARTLSFVMNIFFIFFVADTVGLSRFATPWVVSVLNYIISIYILYKYFNFNKQKKMRYI